MTNDMLKPLAALVERGAVWVSLRPYEGSTRPLEELCDDALAEPIGMPSLASLPRSTRVVVVVSDKTRDEPRAEMFAAVRRALAHLPDGRISVLIASGTHAPEAPEHVLPPDILGRHATWVHNGHDASAMRFLGTTSRGTPVRINAHLIETDFVVCLGRIRPHYFAGMSGGVKGVFPGCGYAPDVRENHKLKRDETARLGRLDDNVCRLDMEEAASLLPTPLFVLNVVGDCDGKYVAAFAGHPVLAHRAACQVARPLFSVTGPRARVVVAADVPPVTDSLYQASKLLPAAGALLTEGGTAILVADCKEGTGPIDIVNHGIYELGIRHHLPQSHRVLLVSKLQRDVVETTYAGYASSIDDALEQANARPNEVTVLFRAGEMIASPI